MPGQLGVNAQHVVHETIDGETILIHLGTGTYYSLDGVGAAVWELLADGIASERLAACLSARYDAEPALIERAVAGFVQELLAEELLAEGLLAEGLLAATEPAPAPPAGATNVAGLDGASRTEFLEPVLHKYTDMQEFMLVDPLHDVEAEAGWPHVKAG
ncbi:MAG TPA: PqqD family protein [Solirubrobacteraceae bacterium]|nr:PqqD family protein [Solirubrobacteraceae bacterium]